MDGENNGKPYEQMDDLGVPLFLETPTYVSFVPIYQWLFLVPLKGGIGSIFHPPEGKDYKWYISGIFHANWGIICYLPPFRGTRNSQ